MQFQSFALFFLSNRFDSLTILKIGTFFEKLKKGKNEFVLQHFLYLRLYLSNKDQTGLILLRTLLRYVHFIFFYFDHTDEDKIYLDQS